MIWLHQDLTQAEQRSTLVHEQIHAERGDQACCMAWHEARQEREVAQLAARRLIPLEHLAEAQLWTQELWVDVETVPVGRRSGTRPDVPDPGDRMRGMTEDDLRRRADAVLPATGGAAGRSGGAWAAEPVVMGRVARLVQRRAG